MTTSFDRTKILATVGPASISYRTLLEMAKAGADMFRLNFSHGSHEEHARTIGHINRINRTTKSNIGMLADLQGPKIRIGEMKDNKVFLKNGSKVTITTNPCVGTESVIPVTYRNFPSDVSRKESVMIGDGLIELEVLETNKKDRVLARVISGGLLSSRKGINLPYTRISANVITPKDMDDLRFITGTNVDWIGLSFVRSASDIIKLKRLISKSGCHAKVVAKIEKPEALMDIDDIVKHTDAVMVARGDLGVEVPLAQVPIIQKDIVAKCTEAAKPVIVATQMMESMVSKPVPTRAEVTDVANAVFDGADAILLSGETAIGKYPVKVIATAREIIETVEKQESVYTSTAWLKGPDQSSETFLSDAICHNACRIANDLGASAIICMTQSGYTAFKISSFRPKARIFVFTNNSFLLNTLNLVWGVKAFHYSNFVSTDVTISEVKKILRKEGYVESGDVVVNVASMPLREKGRSNMIKVSRIE